MSLIKQLWLALIFIMILAFGGSFVISAMGARNYLEQQLYLKNQDNAASLALAISQLEKDQVTLELLVGAHFDSGHYQLIRLVDPGGTVLVERKNPPVPMFVPDWFVRLVPIKVDPGSAQIQNGWRQFATLTLASHDRFAYQALWDESVELACWFLGGLILCGLAGSTAVRYITRPVGAVVSQAEAIGDRKFVTIHEPRTVEFRRIVRAMNQLSSRVGSMLEEETERLEKLRLIAHHDPLTGLANRQHFFDLVESVLFDEEAASGSMAIGRVAGLDALNRALGRQVVDQLLARIGERLKQLVASRPEWHAGRLNGADFALFAVAEVDTHQVVRELSSQLHLAVGEACLEDGQQLPVGGTLFMPGEDLSAVLSRSDGALITAERSNGLEVQVLVPGSGKQIRTDLNSWRQTLTAALGRDNLRLAEFPVRGSQGGALHFEAPVRLYFDGDWQPAAVFMPWVARLGMLPRLDARVVRAALETVRESNSELGIHMSAESLNDQQFRVQVLEALKRNPEAAARIWMEISEAAAFRQIEVFRDFGQQLKALGCKLGLEHVGSHFSRINELQELGLDFIKIDAALIRGASANLTSQAFLRGLCTIAHAIGLQVIAEGVRHENEPDCLFDLGFDGVTGPGVK